MKYLLNIPWKFAKYILRFRLSNHKLNIETGRYTGINRELRICDKCQLNVLGDEFHLCFVCTNQDIIVLRSPYILPFYRNHPYISINL